MKTLLPFLTRKILCCVLLRVVTTYQFGEIFRSLHESVVVKPYQYNIATQACYMKDYAFIIQQSLPCDQLLLHCSHFTASNKVMFYDHSALLQDCFLTGISRVLCF